MQPSPILWKKYVDEIERLEKTGTVSPDDAVILRATSVGRDAFMTETLGDESALGDDLPLTVLQRVQSSIAEPLQIEVASLESQLANAEGRAQQTREEKQREASARQKAEAKVEDHRGVIDEMKGQIRQIQADQQERTVRIGEQAARFAHRWVTTLTWSVRALVLLASAWIILMISSSGEYPFGSLSWVLAVMGVLGFAVTFLPQVTGASSKWEASWAKRRARAKILQAGYAADEASLLPSSE